MRIAFLTSRFQHPLLPGSARVYYLIRELAPLHEITLLALGEEPVPVGAREDTAALAGHVEVFETGLGRAARRGERLSARRRETTRMRAVLARLHRESPFDVAVLHGPLLLPVWQGVERLPLVADVCDADSLRIRQRAVAAPLGRRPALYARAAAVRRRERRLARATPYVVFVSARDRDAVLGPRPGAVIPNGIDLDYWRRRAPMPARGRRIVFTGVLDDRPIEDAALLLADEVLPLVQKQVPEAEVVVVGRDPGPSLRERAARPEVTVTGFVDDVRSYLDEAAVFVAPLRFACGQQTEVLEAMAMEVPVVTTPVVAAGLEIDGEGAPLALGEHAGGVAGTVVRLLRDDAERRNLAAAGRRFVERHAVWSRSAEALERLCLAATQEWGTSPRLS